MKKVTSAKNSPVPPGFVELNWLARELPDPEQQREYAAERCIVAVTEALGEAVADAGVPKRKIAELIGVTPARVSHMLNEERNLTLKSVADVLWACGLEVKGLELGPLGVAVVPAEHAHEWVAGKYASEVQASAEKQVLVASTEPNFLVAA